MRCAAWTLLLASIANRPVSWANETPRARASVRLLPAAAGVLQVEPFGALSTAGAPCSSQVTTHTDFDFVSGPYTTQAGFQEGELAAASCVLPAAAFPLRVDLLEMVFGQNNATVSTTTQWSALVWRGVPSTGTPLATFASGSDAIPHLVLPPSTEGAILRVQVDAACPLVITDDGSHTFSVGFRIDDHNDEPADPCLASPPAGSNAFPATDVSGLANPAGNWLYGLNCGPFGCPANGGWARFSHLPQYCRPTGDWVLRAAVTPAFAVTEAPGLTCGDGLDNDCDGSTDCEDGDCCADSLCSPVAASSAARVSVQLDDINPFAPGDAFRVAIPAPAHVRLDVFDAAGRFVACILDRGLEAGIHHTTWDGRSSRGTGLPTGVYFARLSGEQLPASMRKLVMTP
jgi:hypothetical protein